MKNELNGIIYNDKVYIPEDSNKPCRDCDLAQECRHGLLAGLLCGVIGYDQCFRFSQSLTDKINKE